MTDRDFLLKAIAKAEESVTKGGFPAGAIIVKNGKIISEGISIGKQLSDPTSHGELSCIRDACSSIRSSDLSESTLYSSMEPCIMCIGAAMWAGIEKIIYAAPKEKVSPEYYGGHYKTIEINQMFLKPLQLIHISELEEHSLKIVSEWEQGI